MLLFTPSSTGSAGLATASRPRSAVSGRTRIPLQSAPGRRTICPFTSDGHDRHCCPLRGRTSLHTPARGMWLQVIVDPAGKNRGFHRRRPGLRQCFHPTIQVETRGGQGTFCVNVAAAILHAVADRPLVNIQPDVNIFCMGEPPWCL